ncbi:MULTISPECIES: SDR family NAD(P)-dependent oxidoreductase [Mycobacteroides]|uniref:Short-chain dehydrogenase n=1 Tax=Mycobacteroides immunogenum TaxID=83262 RepID=A0A7V8LM82_9MYCO|nr:SDR family oxidoreductase [Mycobacteroides immunogenum]AMT72632.1 short-chain dehydrogenase [Mycobacteroides immunogenum]ANO05797.1 short-chain dehydrogenase [Mycobacteroides immunogenum]KIU41047.1 short-chain dehydrogenase [Mycobacteroides immunogenum]KPG05954.1 short-chain dehydrogenase [Mycobacteroides immunogenum]KPG07602.1 short-chain dehydrogenase [Mycobacteroides immunogenum]
MTNDWPTGQAAFVTGAASGIGLGIARALVAAGAKVALADIDAARLVDVTQELTDAGGTVLAVPLDISDPEQWSAAADRAEEALGPISILCNNAGVNGGGLIDETPLDVWRWVFKINTEAQFIGVSTFLPRFKSRGGRAHIMNTASMAGIVPMARVGAYCASKFASFGFSMVLRDELQGTDVGVSVLCPGTVATRLNVTAGEAEAKVRGEGVNTAAVEGNGALLAAGADPDRVGEQVVEAIRQRDFLIITHRDWEPLVTAVHAEIGRTFGEYENRYGADPTVPFLIQGANPITT